MESKKFDLVKIIKRIKKQKHRYIDIRKLIDKNYNKITRKFIIQLPNSYQYFRLVHKKKINDRVYVRIITKENEHIPTEKDDNSNFILLNKLVKKEPEVIELFRLNLCKKLNQNNLPVKILPFYTKDGYFEIYCYGENDTLDVIDYKKLYQFIHGHLHAISEGDNDVKYNGKRYDPLLYNFFWNF